MKCATIKNTISRSPLFRRNEISGDIADSAEKSEMLKAKKILDKLKDPNGDGNLKDGIPYIPVFGNHDVWPYTEEKEANFPVFSLGWKTGVKPDAELWQPTINWLKDCLKEHKICLKGNGRNKNIIFSHIPFVEDRTMAFSPGYFSPYGYMPGKFDEIKEIIEENSDKILANFGGHIHGFEKYVIEKLPGFEKILFFNTNKEYPALSTVPVLTTEATMVGSNDENPKGIIRVVKVFGSNEINYNNWETNIDGTEFIAFNPTIDFEYSGEKTGCVFFVAHAFTKKQNYTFVWDFGDGNFSSGKEAHHCYLRPGDYEATLITKDKSSNLEEKITRKIKIKEEAIYPRIIKIKEEAKEKIELIWSSLGKNATEFGRTMKDWLLIKVKHSPSTPVGAIFVHPEKTKEDIDLDELIADYDLEKRKSILYIPEWPETIEKSKILFIPK